MTKYTRTLAANGTVSFDLFNIRGNNPQDYLFEVTGTFGSGTVTVSIATNGTTTPTSGVTNAAGTAVTFTANGNTGLRIPSSGSQNPIKLLAVLTGATNPSLTFTLCDGR